MKQQEKSRKKRIAAHKRGEKRSARIRKTKAEKSKRRKEFLDAKAAYQRKERAAIAEIMARHNSGK